MTEHDRPPLQRYKEGDKPTPDYLRKLCYMITDGEPGTQRIVADLVGINSRTFRNFLSGKFLCPDEILAKLEKRAGIN